MYFFTRIPTFTTWDIVSFLIHTSIHMACSQPGVNLATFICGLFHEDLSSIIATNTNWNGVFVLIIEVWFVCVIGLCHV